MNTRLSLSVFLCILAAGLLIPVVPATGHASGGAITIKGSTTVLPIAQVAAEEFMDRNPGIKISVQGGGSGVGISSLIDKTTDIATSSRRIKPEEIEKAKAKGVTPSEIVIALDGIAVIVHPGNKVSALTKAQLKDIYTGRISNWKELGGADAKIVTVSRDTSSGTYEAFEALAINKEKVRPDALTTASNQAVAQTVAQTPGAIGYVGHGYLTGKVKDVTVDGVKCTKQNIQSGKYPLARELYMYTNGKPSGNTALFVHFVLSKDGQKLVEDEGFVDILK
ncbi:MAG TPA: phosphate ABC transporter substrate-binding protein [Deltaproteobacteria bacterium]|nr:phosphate ABC transporter substrate-binding protein [Deltaproteobacteria bacterium]HQI80555.1 phosphate ABC transporter substrate-binding protein [Deltaproteobacteria bacterium]